MPSCKVTIPSILK